MTVTESQNNGTGVANFASGSYLTDGTAAAITITCGFTPRYVKVVNVTGGSTGLIFMEWFDGMDDANGVKSEDAGTSETALTLITTLGITPAADGFVIGLDTDLNVTSEQLHWIALG